VPVVYEIAQVTLIVENNTPESAGTSEEGIVVHAEDNVGYCHLVSTQS
jgi:hypothetical protein